MLRELGLALILTPLAWAGTGLEAALARMEFRLQGRIGFHAVRGPVRLGHRASERFAYCSTFKWVLGAAVLKAVEEGRLKLDQPVAYGAKQLIVHSPVTAARVKEGRMTVGELCLATISTSDNTAANLLEPLVGGPGGLQRFVRSLGDAVMRFDRMEPALNSNLPGDPRDTTSPEAMAGLLRTVMEGDALSRASKAQLLAWMTATSTGAKRIKASLPQDWSLAHKTGAGENGATNDVGILSPPVGLPIHLCIFVDSARANKAEREAAIAELTRMVVAALE